MDKAKVIALIVVLYALDIGERDKVIKAAAQENNLKDGDLYKFLKKEGYNSQAPKGTAAPDPNKTPPNADQDAKNIPVLVSHKTEYEKYRCAGLVLTRKPENYLVTEAQFEKLKCDPWVAVG